jgi:parallel beta-helix repeat protein
MLTLLLTSILELAYNIQANPVMNLTVETDKQEYYNRDIVQVYGNLTLDGTLVTDGLVGIQIQTSQDELLTIRTLSTGSPPPETPYVFIEYVAPTDQNGNPKFSFLRGTLAYFKIRVANLDIEPRYALMTINTYYGDNTPFGFAAIQTEISAGSNPTFIISIPIPTDAILGTATVYANAYTDWPKLAGTPYCTEVNATFQITDSTLGAGAASQTIQNPITTLQGNETANYNISLKLPNNALRGNYTIYVTSMYYGEFVSNSAAFKVYVLGTIYIRADGSIDPPTASIQRIGNIYTFTDNVYDGVVVERSSIIIDGAGCTLQGSGSATGFDLYSINNVTIKNTKIRSFDYGIWLYSSSGNTISGNNMTANNYCILLYSSPNNKFYHNNFINNTRQVYSSGSVNFWDDGYPSGGNYWSDYTDVDFYSGPYQNETGSDGIWDHPYVIDADNQDQYPLVNPWTPTPNQPPIPSFIYSPIKPIIGEEITFNASASFDPDGDIVSYVWNFGDGTTAYEEIVPHSYSVAHDYTVTLTVTDNEGATASTSTTIKVTKDWNFAIITDLHIGYGYEDYGTVGFNDATGSGDYYWLTDRLDGIVNWINEHEESDNIHFVVVLGDMSDSGEKSELLRAREFLNKLNVPYIPVIGNHDIWPYTQRATLPGWRDLRKTGFPLYTIKEWAGSAVGDQFFYEVFWQQNNENREKIRELFGNSFKTQTEEVGSLFMNYVFTYKKIKFIALDLVDRNPKETTQSSGAKLHPDTQQWLTVKLSENEPTILLSHHALICGLSELTWADASIIDDIIKDSHSRVLVNFAGHNHGNDESVWNPWTHINVVTTEAVCRESTLFPNNFVTRTGNNIRIVTMNGENYKDYHTLRGIGDKTQTELVHPRWAIWVRSPVDLIVTDPEGFTITKEVGEVAGMFYFESDSDGDGELDDIIILNEEKVGDYQITVVPEPNASLTDTYTLQVLGLDATIVLAENVLISDIPTEPYVVNSSAFTLNIPPTTLIDIGEPKFVVNNTTYLTSATPIELTAKDNPYGSGLSSTVYRIHNTTYDSDWIIYLQPFYLTELSDGTYFIDYYSTDYIGNNETTNTTILILTNHSIAMTSITFSNPSPITNETITIYVTVENRGNYTETFSVSLNYTLLIDASIGTQTITLAPGEPITLNFTWTPTASGRYEIKAYTSTIPNDINPSDNSRTTYIYVRRLIISGPHYTQFCIEYWIVELIEGKAARIVSNYY